MKLKYYMRGLGVGILLATLIISFGGNKKNLSDQEIIKRAEALGMVMQEKQKDSLDQMLEDITPMPTESAEPTAVSSSEDDVEPTVQPTDTPQESPVTTEEPKTEKEPTEKPKKIMITIQKGMTSDSVAELLQDMGLVESASGFNSHIIKAGKANVIRTGDFYITEGTSYKEITDIITKK